MKDILLKIRLRRLQIVGNQIFNCEYDERHSKYWHRLFSFTHRKDTNTGEISMIIPEHEK